MNLHGWSDLDAYPAFDEIQGPVHDRIQQHDRADPHFCNGDRALVQRQLWSGARPHGWIVAKTFAGCVAGQP